MGLMVLKRERYMAFLRAKAAVVPQFGFTVDPRELNPLLKPHQRDIVIWALRGGRRAIFAAFGLGKSFIQIEIARIIRNRTRGRFLIVAPLGVRLEFARDVHTLATGDHPAITDEQRVQLAAWQAEIGPGAIPTLKFIRSIGETDETGIYITNYETVRDGKLDPAQFAGASLDEAACLRSFGGSLTFREFMRLFEGRVKYKFVATATPSPNEFIELLAYSAFLEVLDVGEAKAQPLDARILTPTGWRSMGEIKVGDEVIAGDGSITTVLGVFPQGEREIVCVKFSDGSSTECDLEHLWLTSTELERCSDFRYQRRIKNGAPVNRRHADFSRVRTTAEIADSLRSTTGNPNHRIPLVNPIEFPERDVSVDPWLLGALIGDGYLRKWNVSFSTADEWIVNKVRSVIPDELQVRHSSKYDYAISHRGGRGKRNILVQRLRGMGLAGKHAWEKFVPEHYLVNSMGVRLAVLRGLMDTDGTISRGRASYSTTSLRLADDVIWLVRSLGGVAQKTVLKTTGRDCYLVYVKLPDELNPFSLPRKVDKWICTRSAERIGPRRSIVGVAAVGRKLAQCIAVSHPSRLYVTDDFIVTHNTRFFKRNSEKADNLTLHEHKKEEFWRWCASWAIFLQRPSELGYDDTGYDLPPLEVHWHEIPSDHSVTTFDPNGQKRLLNNAAIGVVDAAREKRRSLDARINKMLELCALDLTAHRILWHDLEDERRAIQKAIPGVHSVYGTQDMEERERRLLAFSNGEIQELSTKPELAGVGSNFQRHCSWAIYLGIGFKFHDFYQSLHRLHRFLQTRPVRIDLIYTEAEREVRRILEQKWQQHNELMAEMSAIIRQYGLAESSIASSLTRSIEVERVETAGAGWRAVNNDSVFECGDMEDDSAHLILTSIPFGNQYEYSPSFMDFGHTDSNQHFWEQMDFLTPELLRVLKPGRIAAIHVKDRITPGGINKLGFQTVYPFHVDAINHFTKHGFAYMGMKTIVTDVVRENNQTYRIGWTEQCKDGTKMGVGMPEYLLIFRKPPSDTSNSYADQPVVKSKGEYTRSRWQIDAHGFARSSGNRSLMPSELDSMTHAQIFQSFRKFSLDNIYDFERHVAIAETLERCRECGHIHTGQKRCGTCECAIAGGRLPQTFMLLQPASWSDEVWSDVTRMLSLNSAQSAKGRENHLCPLPFDLADRAITQYTEPGELVLDPFGGLMTVPYRAILLGRRGIGVELNPRYVADGIQYLTAAEQKLATPTLFDLLEEQEFDPSVGDSPAADPTLTAHIGEEA